MVEEYPSGRVKTCENCVRAKIRCSHSPDSSVCDRCRRLKKECCFRPARPRVGRKKRATRIEALEDKLDRLMGQINLVTPRRPEVQALTPTSETSCTTHTHLHSHPSGDTLDVIGKGLVSHELANKLLNDYREAMLLFPFVMLPTTTTVEDLRTQKPFLLLCILFFSSYQDGPFQKSLEEIIMAYVSNSILHPNHDCHIHSLDLETLQGLLVVLSGTRQLHHLCRFPRYVQLAVSIINDGRLDRPPKYRLATRLDIEGGSDITETGPREDESRALIGCFLLNSTDAIIKQKTCTLPWTPFIESCAADLSQKCEYPTDRYMIYYVQLQHMLERMNALTATNIDPNQDVEQYIQSFRAEVDQYKDQLPINPNCDTLIATQFHTLELQLCQISLLDTKAASMPSDSFLLVSRSDTLCRGLAASKRFFDYYFTLPPMIEKNYSIVIWLSTGFLVAAPCKLVIAALNPSLRHNREVQELRDALDIPAMLQFYVTRHDAVAKTCKNGMFSHYQEWLVAATNWFEKAYQLARLEAAKIIENEGTFSSFDGPQQFPQNTLDQGDASDPNLFGLDFEITMEELMGGFMPLSMPGMFDLR